MGCGASTNKSTDDIVEHADGNGWDRGQSPQRADSSALQGGRNDSAIPTVSVSRAPQSSVPPHQQVAGGLPVSTYVDLAGCHVASCFQSKQKVDSMSKWLDQARKYRLEQQTPLADPQNGLQPRDTSAADPTSSIVSQRETNSYMNGNGPGVGDNSASHNSLLQAAGQSGRTGASLRVETGSEVEMDDKMDEVEMDNNDEI